MVDEKDSIQPERYGIGTLIDGKAETLKQCIKDISCTHSTGTVDVFMKLYSSIGYCMALYIFGSVCICFARRSSYIPSKFSHGYIHAFKHNII